MSFFGVVNSLYCRCAVWPECGFSDCYIELLLFEKGYPNSDDNCCQCSILGMFCCQNWATFALPMRKLIEQFESAYSVVKFATAHIAVREASPKICKVNSFVVIFSLCRNCGASMLEKFLISVRVASKLLDKGLSHCFPKRQMSCMIVLNRKLKGAKKPIRS